MSYTFTSHPPSLLRCEPPQLLQLGGRSRSLLGSGGRSNPDSVSLWLGTNTDPALGKALENPEDGRQSKPRAIPALIHGMWTD